MSSEWRPVSLGECIELDTGFPFKSAGYTDSADAVRLLRGDNIGQGQLRWDGVRKWSRQEYDALSAFELRENDLVLAMDRPWISAGLKFARVRKGDLPALLVQRVARLRPKVGIDEDYLHSVVASPDFTQHIQRITTGTAVPHISGKQIQEFSFKLPDFPTQQALGKLLRSLDDRITLLRETNATLEAIAQALFKSWFVDFDPVRAKMEGRTPEGMDEVTAALFPDGFEESALGLVPRGWFLSTVGESFVLTMGQSPPGDTYSTDENGLPFYQGRTDFGFRFPTKRMYCSAPTRVAEVGDTLVSVRAPVGDVNMAIEKCCVGRGVASVRHPQNYRSFTFYAMRGLGARFENFDSEGTIFGSINKKDFQALPVIRPTLSVLIAYDEAASPIDAKIVENEEHIRTLATLRDTLLPRLISGQLRLRDAEAQVAEATS